MSLLRIVQKSAKWSLSGHQAIGRMICSQTNTKYQVDRRKYQTINTSRDVLMGSHKQQKYEQFLSIPQREQIGNNESEMASLIRSTKCLLLCHSYNTLSLAVATELRSFGAEVDVKVIHNEHDFTIADEGDFDIIICPFLARRVPERIWSNKKRPCLIVHPGIPGDRGPASLEFAIKNKALHWGVTVLQAEEEFDRGPIWAYSMYPISDRNTTKTELYVSEVTENAVDTVLRAVAKFKQGDSPKPWQYGAVDIKGNLQPKIKKADRRIDWNQHASDVARLIRMFDTQPGAHGFLKGIDGEIRFFGAKETQPLLYCGDEMRDLLSSAEPGEPIGMKHNAILIKCGEDSSLWVSHLKSNKIPGVKDIKLPATMVYTRPLAEMNTLDYEDIWVERRDNVAYVHFDFYNGAMNVSQSQRLQTTLKNIKLQDDIHIVVLMGGKRFFSTGIHLNVIEQVDEPHIESYANIEAIDGVIKEYVQMEDKLVIACLQGNAGAGGCMMSAAADYTIAHKCVSLTPTYKNMNLYGSEYWTYFLPKKIGEEMALRLTSGTDSIMASEAYSIGLVDILLGRNRYELQDNLHRTVTAIWNSIDAGLFLHSKSRRSEKWYENLEEHRAAELHHMKKCFSDPAYHSARRNFVFH
ncbi:unnamed protein product [Owenia fusiformis]|uniref:Uncharacterized protein n=1 Tax=Owenia fusiformis TaxID=6347 RepID=A0A8S4Q1G5_OWEFU|nr:unnamed protein product [Owenia fusiformis]